jgi:hypothetical protein
MEIDQGMAQSVIKCLNTNLCYAGKNYERQFLEFTKHQGSQDCRNFCGVN